LRRAGSFLALVGLTLAACSASRAPRLAIPDPASAATTSGQWLYRAELSSPEGSVSLRLALRVASERTFDLEASDVLGAAAWRVAVDDSRAVWIDFASRRFCRSAADDAAAWVGFRTPLSARELASILRRTLPGRPSPADGEVDWTDDAGRRWTGVVDDAGWKRWTLRIDDRPRLWYRFDGAESVLSGREPAFQLRWKEAASGALPTAGLGAPVPPDGFREEECPDASAS
jgi:hypothetical protein